MNNDRIFSEEEAIEINRLREEVKEAKSDLKNYKDSLEVDISNITYYANKNYKDLNKEKKTELDFSIGGFQYFPENDFWIKSKNC